jgi:hypothetical protein
MARQPEQQQQQQASFHTHPCPTCKQSMKMVGSESTPNSSTLNLLTFQCGCGQVIAAMLQ